jgi:hypothetical protein
VTIDTLAAKYPQLVRGRTLPPDAVRYFVLADGGEVPRPFHLRWLLPALLGTNKLAWSVCWGASWVVLAGGALWWRQGAGDGWERSVAAVATLCALPGILGPPAVIPVGVDLPAMALGVCSAAFTTDNNPGWIFGAVLMSLLAGAVKETTPIWIALWSWSWLPLLGLAAPLVRALLVKPGPDPLGPRFQQIADHPVQAAFAAHAGRWRDARLMVAPWGVCLAALYDVDWRLILLLGLAYAQLLIATDSVRLYQYAAGPAMAVAAAAVIPLEWLWLAVAVHVVWWFNVERV